ncbi:MAG: HEPN domain-containing protein [Acidobacteria bacterium]|jgi:uncharacterized protein (UPF0332 family)|nr:HEPN domain-containing protein [Acidobacteriota bacterium]
MEIAELLAKANQSIKAAEKLFDEGFSDFSVGRSYFAMFYALEALLLSLELSFSKHSAVIAAFGKEFIKTGKMDAQYHADVLEAFDLRNAGDYGAPHAVPREKATNLIKKAKELLKAAKAYLANHSTG